MKASTRRLIILDVLIGISCVLQMNIRATPWMMWPVILSDTVLIIYGLWLLGRAWNHDKLQF
jgi:hypothetical protein